MKNRYTVARAQAIFSRLLKQAERQPVAITRHDETVAYILSANRMEAIIETLEIMGNSKAMKAIRRHQAGKTNSSGYRRFTGELRRKLASSQ